VNFVRSFIPACSSVCEPLSRLTAKDSDFVWGKEQDEAFERLKMLLKTAPTLAFPSEDAHLSLFTDASDVGVGAVLIQTKDSNIQVLAFLSKTLSDVQRRWSVIEKECWAIVFAMLKLEPLLKGRKFDLFTDHKNLTFIQRSPNAKISRWWLRVSEFSFDIRHVKGVENGAADCCSRLVKFSKDPETLMSLRIVPDTDTPSAPLTRIREAQAKITKETIEEEGLIRDDKGFLRSKNQNTLVIP
ncbi:hypothetical protein ADUPG1_005422, partial [Aduncisulcus paluster]